MAPAPPATWAPPADAVEPSLANSSFLSDEQRGDGQDERERVVVALELLLEEGAALAAADVTAGGGAELAEALGGGAELEADVVAAEVARLGGLGERDAGAHEQRLDGGDGGLHGVCDLVVGERVDLAQQQRGALGLGQLVHVGDELAEALAAHDLVACGDALLGVVDVHGVDADGRGAAQVV